MKKTNPQDTTLRNLRAAKRRIAALETQQATIRDVVVLMATWIAATPAGTAPLSAENVRQIVAKLKADVNA